MPEGQLEKVRKRRGPYAGKRDAFIASASREINRKGVKGMTFADVAAPLAVVPTAVVYYFSNKEALAEACFLNGIGRFRDMAARSAELPEATARLSDLVRRHLETRAAIRAGDAPEIAAFSDILALGSQVVNEAYVEMFRQTRVLLDGGSHTSRKDLNGRTMLMVGQLTWLPTWLPNWRRKDFARIADRMSDVLERGLAASDSSIDDLQLPDLDFSVVEPRTPRAQFLTAATVLINQEGYHGMSVERISARLNVTKGAFYHHHDSKGDLVEACFERTFGVMWRAIDAAEAAGGSGLQIVARLLDVLVGLQLSDMPLLRTSALSTVPETLRAQLMMGLRRITIRLASILCDGIADGSIRPVDTTITAQMLTAAINGANELDLWRRDAGSDEARQDYVRAILCGFVA